MSGIQPQVADRQRGFTVAELMVSLFVTLTVLLAVLSLFDFTNKLSRAQTNIADMQQSLRVAQDDTVRLIRMAGRGGLPVGNLPNGQAVAVRDNVAAGSLIGGAGTPEIQAESDVLTIRGVFSSPLFQVASADPAAFQLTRVAGAPVSGTVVVRSTTPTGIRQDLARLKDAVDNRRPEGLLLVSPLDGSVHAVAELDPAASSVTDPDRYVLAFKITGGTNTAGYSQFSSDGPGTFPASLAAVAFLGLLEEYRFYVRQELAITGNNASDLASKLSRARVYPGTQAPWSDDAGNWRQDVADNVVDFQIALGLDSANGGCTLAADEAGCALAETADGDKDDWMFNGEKAADPAFAAASLEYLRLSTLARTDRGDWQFQAPLLARIENHAFTAASRLNSPRDRQFRRRLLRTVVDLRNLG